MTSSFPIYIHFISFFYLILIDMTSSLVLNSSGENGHSSLFSDYSKCIFSFSSFIIMWIVSLSHTAFIILRGKRREKMTAEHDGPSLLNCHWVFSKGE